MTSYTRKTDPRTRYSGQAARGYDAIRKSKPFWTRQPNQVKALLVGQSVLDIPVGSGRFIDCYQGMDFKGIDISPDMLELARKRGWQDLEIGDITNIPVADKSFDSVVCVHLMMHLTPDDSPAAAEEMKRVARKAIIVDCHLSSKTLVPKSGVIRYSRKLFNDIFSGWKVTKSIGSISHPLMRLEPR